MQEQHDRHQIEQTADYQTSLQRILQRTEDLTSAQSFGETLLPFVLALAEACWLNGILIALASLDFVQTPTALLPFWGPPAFLCLTIWLFQRTLYQEALSTKHEENSSNPGVPASLRLLFGVLGLLTIGLIWLHIYAGANFLLDPRWLLTFINDLLSLNEHLYQALAIAALAVYCCWRGSRLAQTTLEPGHVKRQLWIGLTLLCLAAMIRAGMGLIGASVDTGVLVLMFPALLYFALSAHALARISFVRRTHPFGLEGNVGTQERAVLSVIGAVGLALLAITLLGSALFSSAFFAVWMPLWRVLGIIYGWLVEGLSLILGLLAAPLLWLFTWLVSFLPHRTTPLPPPSSLGKILPRPIDATGSPAFELAARILLPILLVLGLILVLVLIVRRRRQLRIVRKRVNGDEHESVWSWELFWRQLQAWLFMLLRRKRAEEPSTASVQELDELPKEPTARTIRELYRALLQKAASLGYVRRRNETPLEFQRRLNELHPTSNEPQLGRITEVYALTRYGGTPPSALELASAQQSWDELKQKWEMPSSHGKP